MANFALRSTNTLFLLRKRPKASYKDIQEMIERYKRIGPFPVLEKCWPESRHDTHLMVHTADYLDYISRLFIITPECRVQPKISVKTINNKTTLQTVIVM